MKTRSEEDGIAALRDTTGDFKADVIEHFSDMTPMDSDILWETGMASFISPTPKRVVSGAWCILDIANKKRAGE